VSASIPKDADLGNLTARSLDDCTDEELNALIINGLNDEQLKAVVRMGRPTGETETS
jgi:hypothetical protein